MAKLRVIRLLWESNHYYYLLNLSPWTKRLYCFTVHLKFPFLKVGNCYLKKGITEIE